MGRRSDPQWRDVTARNLVLENLSWVRSERALMMLERGEEIRSALETSGSEVLHWDRRAGGHAAVVSAWPPEGEFDWIGLRLPKGVDELRMQAAVAGSRLAPRGVLWIYGASDEGIQSVRGRLEADFRSLEDVAVGGRCRVIEAREPVAGRAVELSAWIEPIADARLSADPWVSFPGCFAHGRVDQGTELLLSNLPEITSQDRVLDFACGTGMIADLIRSGAPGAEIVLLDNDALSLEAARRNLPGATMVLSQGFAELDRAPFDWIVSNPPYHLGKAGTASVLEELCLCAAGHLKPGGGLRCVVQKTHALESILKKNFQTVTVVAESARFRVWDSLTSP